MAVGILCSTTHKLQAACRSASQAAACSSGDRKFQLTGRRSQLKSHSPRELPAAAARSQETAPHRNSKHTARRLNRDQNDRHEPCSDRMNFDNPLPRRRKDCYHALRLYRPHALSQAGDRGHLGPDCRRLATDRNRYTRYQWNEMQQSGAAQALVHIVSE